MVAAVLSCWGRLPLSPSEWLPHRHRSRVSSRLESQSHSRPIVGLVYRQKLRTGTTVELYPNDLNSSTPRVCLPSKKTPPQPTEHDLSTHYDHCNTPWRLPMPRGSQMFCGLRWSFFGWEAHAGRGRVEVVRISGGGGLDSLRGADRPVVGWSWESRDHELRQTVTQATDGDTSFFL